MPLDGWLVRTVRPYWMYDGIRNPTTFFARKILFALSVQCIVDDREKVIWVSYSYKGGSHDSICFRDTELYGTLERVRDE